MVKFTTKFFNKKQCDSQRYKGFTLAEVLITLGVIGVVAAFTIPTLMNNIQDAQHKTAYKKAYSTLSQALSQANTDNALLESSGAWDVNILTNFKTIMSYIKVQKSCYGTDYSQCWNPDGEGFNSSSYKNGYPNINDLIAVDVSGMSWATYANGFTFDIIVDTNGFKGPNQMGKDRFMIYLHSEQGSGQAGTPVKVSPDYDNNSWACNYNKCATEHNYLPTSWLMK